MEAISQIPKILLEKYNVYKEDNLKYSCLKINNFEEEYLSKENSLNDALNKYKESLEKIYETISDFVLNNKNTFNDTCQENTVKSIDYLIILKSTLYFINTIISKLENKEIENETFQSICEKLGANLTKIFESQYPKNDPSLVANIEDFVKLLLKYSTDIKNSQNKPGMVLTTLIAYMNIKLIPEINNSIKKFSEIENFKDSSFFNNQTKAHEIVLFDLLMLLKRIKNNNDLIYYGYFIAENDLVNIKEKSEEWDTLKKLIWTVKPKKDIDLAKIISEMSKKQMMRMSQMMKMREGGGPKIGAMVGNLVNNFFNSSQAEYDYKKTMMKLYGFNMNPPTKPMKMNPMMKKMISSRMPSIECRRKLYIRKEYKPLSLEYIKELNDFLNGKITEPQNKNLLLFDDNYKVPENILKKKLFATKLEKNEKDDYISTRLLNGSSLLFKDEKPEVKGGIFGFGAQPNTSEHKNEFKNALIIHLNGGSFRGTNNSMMERYQRVWSKDIGVALMIIKKPEKEGEIYPETLNYFYQVYMWLINHAKEELNMDIKKIIISGDSAGGNLAMTFVNLLVGINLFEKKDIKIPDLVLLEYPNMSLEIGRMSTSICLAASDYFFSHAFFKNLVDNYLGDYKDYKNMLVSPLYASDKLIENLPRIRFFFGDRDVGRDEFLKGVYYFRNCKDIRAYNFLELLHAFNGIDNPDIFEMVKEFIIEEVKDILQ